MSKAIAASIVKGLGFILNRAAGNPVYAIAKTAPLVGAQSANVGFAYKNAETGEYAITLGLDRTVHADFNAAKAHIKLALAA